jgi:hypothetical protein
MTVPNVFKALCYYGSSQSENYLTESFVHVLRVLKARAGGLFIEIIRNLSGLDDLGGSTQDVPVQISTQSSLPEGRPDICFNIGRKLKVFVEVKEWAPLAPGQLEGYYNQIRDTFGDAGHLVLLTRSRQKVQETDLDPGLFHHVCWYEVHSWLQGLEIEDDLASHYVSQFTEFLEGKAMGVQKVSWEYENGIKSMLVLTNLLETAVSESWPESSIRHTAGWSWRGLYVDDYFVGIRFDEPTLLVFENDMAKNPSYKANLDLRDAHFHSLDAGEQLETLVEFLRASRIEASRPKEEETP